MSQRREQTVIGARKIDIDRFDIARPGRKDMKIPDCQIREEISFEAKISLQIFSRSVMQRDPPADCQQNWAMKNCEERHAHSKRRRRASPPSPGRPHVCLTVSGHESDSISALPKSKAQIALPGHTRRKVEPAFAFAVGLQRNALSVADEFDVACECICSHAFPA